MQRIVTSHLAGVLLLAVLSCNSPKASPGRLASQSQRPSDRSYELEILTASDARITRDLLALSTSQASAMSPSNRKALVQALARQQDRAAIPELTRWLVDRDPELRKLAAFGLGSIENGAEQTEQPLRVALAAETEADVRAELLWNLARTARELEPILLAELEAPSPDVHAAACRAAGAVAVRGIPFSPALAERIASYTAGETTLPVRKECLFALQRGALPPNAPQILAGLRADDVAHESDVEAKILLIKVTAKYAGAPDTPTQLASSVSTVLTAIASSDSEARVRAQAFRSLGTLASKAIQPARRYAAAIDSLSPTAANLRDESAVIATAADSAESFANVEEIQIAARRLLERLETLPAPNRQTPEFSWSHCRVARLVDISHRWPSLVRTCGARDLDATEHRVLEADVLGQAAKQPAPPRTATTPETLLVRLLADTSPRVRAAAASALGSVHSPTALRALLAAVRDSDFAVAASAADALEEWVKPLLTADDRATLAEAVRDALERHRQEPEAILSFVNLIDRTALDGIALDSFLQHRISAVRDRVAVVRKRDFAPMVPLEKDPEITAAVAATHFVVATTGGEFEIELAPQLAPVTIQKLVKLARRGFYNGLRWHRVVPAFVVQGGDPRGDGYGGPGFTLRCEDSSTRYVRGTVGMALAGRDTGGSQFFIALSNQPHLDGEYTVIGRVSVGMEIVDRLTPYDEIRWIAVR